MTFRSLLVRSLVLTPIAAASCSGILGIEDGSLGEESADAGAADGAGPDAELPPTANVMFLTSMKFTGDLGGIAGADAKCASAAVAGGLPDNTYIAFLSMGTSSFRSRLGSARGFVRSDGEPSIDQLTDIASATVYYPPILTELGTPIPSGFEEELFWSATGPMGEVGGSTCSGWTESSANTAMVGNAFASGPQFHSEYESPCSISRRLLCVGTDLVDSIQAPSESGRRAFVSTGFLSGSLTIGMFDAQCAGDASNAGLSGSYLAYVSEFSAPPAARFSDSGPGWVRTDGVRITSTSGDLQNGRWSAPINRRADGSPAFDFVWTGADTFSTSGQNCAGWTMVSPEFGVVGNSGFLGPRAVNDGSFDCDQSMPVYCLQE